MSYGIFSSVYDILTENVPYERIADSICSLLHNNGVDGGLLLDLGCGTGTLSFMLEKMGYDVIGVDASEDMLMVAREKSEDSDILYLNQDMCEFELYGTVAAVVSVCDCVNYLLEDDDVIRCFKLVNNYLDPEGIFFFDFNTRYKYETVIGDAVIAENREECSFIWENYYHEDGQINEYDLTIFAKEGELYRKFTETHFQKGYTLEQMKQAIEQAGMEFVAAYDGDTHGAVHHMSERIYIMAREKGK